MKSDSWNFFDKSASDYLNNVPFFLTKNGDVKLIPAEQLDIGPSEYAMFPRFKIVAKRLIQSKFAGILN